MSKAAMLSTQIKILDEKAEVPSRAHDTDTGYDLKFIGVHKIIGDVIFFKTGISVAPPIGYYFDIVPRSSISKLPLELANSVGVIDEHYRGEVLVAIRITHSLMGQEKTNVSFPQGLVKIFGVRPPTMTAVAQQILMNKPKLCQMILRKRENTEFVVTAELDETARGDGGFGSTDDKLISKKVTPRRAKPLSGVASKRKAKLTDSDDSGINQAI